MPEPDSLLLKALQTKLQNLVVCVMAKAATDPAFARELEEVLLTDSLKRKIVSQSTRSKRHHFSPVTILHAKGETGLRADLEMQTDDELRRVARAQGLFKGRDVKTIPRADLLAEIISSAQHRLTQGESFLKNT
jgi:hypothetical protein